MTWIGRGRVQGGSIILSEPISFPEGTEVVARVEPLVDEPETTPSESAKVSGGDFFGMWADREEMRNSAEWVRGERSKRSQRSAPPE